jgi:hypothetical protein
MLQWFKKGRNYILIKCIFMCFDFALEYVIRKVQVELKLSGTYQLLVDADDMNLLGDNTDPRKKNTETLIDASKEDGLQVNAEKKLSICCCLITRMQCKIMI